MSINDATSVASAASSNSSIKKVTKSLTNNIIGKTIHQLRRKPYKIYYAKSYDQLPNDDLCEFLSDLVAYDSGPDNGINDISLFSYRRNLNPRIEKQDTTIKPSDAVNKPEDEKPPPPPPSQQSVTSQLITSTTNTITTVPKDSSEIKKTSNPDEKNLITECCDSFIKAGITRWNLKHHASYGLACSLYEYNSITNSTVGDPIADTYAILTRRNSSILILADGVNWGPRSRLAARCAVRASMNYINRNIFFNTQALKIFTTHDIFRIMMRSFDAAQEFILQKKGTMTTLCCSVVCKLKDSATSLWAVCTLSIGDSTAYVFNRERGIFELTYGARNLNDDRDMRNVGGALGHVYGNKPDVSNLNYSVMYVKEKDIVFMVSDGISDNLDPCVSQTAARKTENLNSKPAVKTSEQLKDPKYALNEVNTNNKVYRHKNSLVTLTGHLTNNNGKKTPSMPKDDLKINASSLPQMSPYERYVCSLSHMNEILLRNKTLNEKVSAQECCAIFIDHVLKLTSQKRESLEHGLIEASKLNDEDKLKYQADLKERIQKLKGKLDHASIVAYEVGLL